jgi:hypothetical protein
MDFENRPCCLFLCTHYVGFWLDPVVRTAAMHTCNQKSNHIWVIYLGVNQAPALILCSWNPDPSILRVGNEYYIATSSFEYFPGVPIYKSTDLANWELFSHALTSPQHVQLYGVPTGAGEYSSSNPSFLVVNIASRCLGSYAILYQWTLLLGFHD